MKYCRNRAIDRQIRKYNTLIYEYICEHDEVTDLSGTDTIGRALKAYRNAVRRLEKMKNG